MKKRLSFLLLFVLMISTPLLNADEAVRFTVIKNPYRFTTYYELVGKEGCEGRVIQSDFRLRTTYDLYNSNGDYEGQGVCRALSLGALYAWAKDIDVYDSQGNKIGSIEGKTITTAKAKYNFYEGAGHLIATAYLDYDHSSFTLIEPSEKERTIGILKSNLIEGGVSGWSVILYEPSQLDLRILKLFSAFIVDYEDFFIRN